MSEVSKHPDGGISDMQEARLKIQQFEHEQAELKEQLRQASKMEAIGQLAGGIAHDFNNILGGIMGYADVIKLKLEKDSPLQVYVERILDATKKAADHTRQLLTFSRKARAQMRLVDIHNTIDSAVALLRHSMDTCLKISCHLKASSAEVLGDESMLITALINLGLNARDAMSSGGEIVIQTENVTFLFDVPIQQQQTLPPGHYVHISVADTGSGMDEETRRHVFEPFYTTKGPTKGTGLGLSAVYGCVKQHKGGVTFMTELGKGTSFDIYLPLADSASVASDVAEVKPIQGSGTVLIVKGEESSAGDDLASMVGSLGYSLTVCESVVEAVEFYRTHSLLIQIVLVDGTVAAVKGRSFLAVMYEINPAAHIIMILDPLDESVEHVSSEYQQKMVSIIKPFSLVQLSKGLAQALC